MPWHAARSEDCPDSKPWACIRDGDGTIEGCHESEEAANAQVRALYAAEEPQTASGEMQKKTFELAELKADDEKGTFTALASVFGNVDLGGDRVLKGAFKKTLERWRKKAKPIPVILSHQWDSLTAYVGKADPRAVFEDENGLMVQGSLFLDKEAGRDVHRLMKEGLLTGWSFGYKVPKGGSKVKDGVNEISEVELFEVGPTLIGMNPEAQLQSVKKDSLEADALVGALNSLPEADIAEEAKARVIAAATELVETSRKAIETEQSGPNEEPERAKSRPHDALKEDSLAASLAVLSEGATMESPAPPPEPKPAPDTWELKEASRAAMLDVLRS